MGDNIIKIKIHQSQLNSRLTMNLCEFEVVMQAVDCARVLSWDKIAKICHVANFID